jgi:hypothetical protein
MLTNNRRVSLAFKATAFRRYVVYIQAVDGKPEALDWSQGLTFDFPQVGIIDWSPDGKHVLIHVSTMIDDQYTEVIYIVDLADTTRRELHRNVGRPNWAKWSPCIPQ